MHTSTGQNISSGRHLWTVILHTKLLDDARLTALPMTSACRGSHAQCSAVMMQQRIIAFIDLLPPHSAWLEPGLGAQQHLDLRFQHAADFDYR